jgi:hypothetical protein
MDRQCRWDIASAWTRPCRGRRSGDREKSMWAQWDRDAMRPWRACDQGMHVALSRSNRAHHNVVASFHLCPLKQTRPGAIIGFFPCPSYYDMLHFSYHDIHEWKALRWTLSNLYHLFFFLASFWLCIRIVAGYYVVTEDVCNRYLCNINIFSLLKKSFTLLASVL